MFHARSPIGDPSGRCREQCLFNVSAQISCKYDAYWMVVERTQRGPLDGTRGYSGCSSKLRWHAIWRRTVADVLAKAIFWLRHHDTVTK